MTARKPDALKKLQGTQRPYRTVERTAVSKGEPIQPEILSDQAKKVWNDLAPELVKLGLLGAVDQSTFTAYCQSYADYLELTEYLNQLGPKNWYMETQSGYRQVIPEVAERNKAFAQMQKLAPRFGLDPSSRSGIDTGKEQNTDTAVEAFLFKAPKVASG
jgi:P27 family predicted phage terminase small subunit